MKYVDDFAEPSDQLNRCLGVFYPSVVILSLHSCADAPWKIPTGPSWLPISMIKVDDRSACTYSLLHLCSHQVNFADADEHRTVWRRLVCRLRGQQIPKRPGPGRQHSGRPMNIESFAGSGFDAVPVRCTTRPRSRLWVLRGSK